MYVHKRATTGRGLAVPSIRDEVEDTTWRGLVREECGDSRTSAYYLIKYLGGHDMRQHYEGGRGETGNSRAFEGVSERDRLSGEDEDEESSGDDMSGLLDENGRLIEDEDSSDDDV